MKKVILEEIKERNYAVICLSATTCEHHSKDGLYKDAIEFAKRKGIEIDNYLNDENYFSDRHIGGFFNFEPTDVSIIIDKPCGCRWELVLAEAE